MGQHRDENHSQTVSESTPTVRLRKTNRTRFVICGALIVLSIIVTANETDSGAIVVAN